MSTALLELEDRIITDTGTMVAKHQLLVQLALADKPFAHLPYVDHYDTNQYHQQAGDANIAKRWVDDDIVIGPSLSSFDWVTPEPYNSIDISEYCMDIATTRGYTTDGYKMRLQHELIRVVEVGMEQFIQCLIWITDTLRQRHILWGVGRGSSCASFIMFLLDINKIDPVKYDIPLEEFYK